MTTTPAPDLTGAGTVTVSMPYYRCPTTIRRAVDAVLSQTHTDLRLVVVNDGDRTTAPWPFLDDITDPRLIRASLRTNMGRYFADAAVLAATTSPWFAIHDADDWAEPDWLEHLVTACHRTRGVAAIAPQLIHRPGSVYPRLEPLSDLGFGTPRLRHVAHHATVYATRTAQRVGGHPGYRIGFDTLWVNVMSMLGPIAVVDRPLYHRQIHPRSLTQNPRTGTGSPERRAVARGLQRLYGRALGAADPARVIRDDVPADLVVLVDEAATRIRPLLDAADADARERIET